MGEPDSHKFNNSFEYLVAETQVPKFIKKKIVINDDIDFA